MRYSRLIDIYRLILAFFVCVISEGSVLRGFQPLAGFATIAFYLLSGYLTCRETSRFEERVTRAIKRTAVLYGCMLVGYLIVNVIYFASVDLRFGDQLPVSMFSNFRVFLSLRTWFEILVLNVWPLPFGGTIWFIQALLYAYLILYGLHKLKLLQKTWFDPAACIVLLVFAVASGELAGLLNFHLFRYVYIPGNFLTRALPYMLLGRMMFHWEKKLPKHRTYLYVIAIVAGLGLSLLEIRALDYFGKLVYTGHLVGNGVVATALTALILTRKEHPHTRAVFNGGLVAKVVYISQEVISFIIMQFVINVSPNMAQGVSDAMPFIIFFICCAGVGIYSLVVLFKTKDMHEIKRMFRHH